MLTEAQRKSVMDYYLGDIDVEEFVTVVGVDPRTDPGSPLRLIREATAARDAEALEAALGVAARHNRIGSDYVDVFCDLLGADWHTRHEDVARWLQELRDPRSVPALYRGARANFAYRDYDEVRALTRKCLWALTHIGDDSAVSAIEALAEEEDPVIRRLAEHHLAKVQHRRADG